VNLTLHHIVMCGLLRSAIFLYLITSMARFSKIKFYWKQKYLLRFSTQCLYETLLNPRRIERDMIKNVCGLLSKYPLFLSDFIELEICRQILEKYSNVKFHKNPYSGSRGFPRVWTDGRTDRHDEASSRSLQFCERP